MYIHTTYCHRKKKQMKAENHVYSMAYSEQCNRNCAQFVNQGHRDSDNRDVVSLKTTILRSQLHKICANSSILSVGPMHIAWGLVASKLLTNGCILCAGSIALIFIKLRHVLSFKHVVNTSQCWFSVTMVQMDRQHCITETKRIHED